MSAPFYKVVGIANGRVIEVVRKVGGAPSESWMISWAAPRGCSFVGRYYPTRGGWCALRIDTAHKVVIPTAGGSVRGWKGYSRGKRVYPNEGAMVMHLMVKLGQTP